MGSQRFTTHSDSDPSHLFDGFDGQWNRLQQGHPSPFCRIRDQRFRAEPLLSGGARMRRPRSGPSRVVARFRLSQFRRDGVYESQRREGAAVTGRPRCFPLCRASFEADARSLPLDLAFEHRQQAGRGAPGSVVRSSASVSERKPTSSSSSGSVASRSVMSRLHRSRRHTSTVWNYIA